MNIDYSLIVSLTVDGRLEEEAEARLLQHIERTIYEFDELIVAVEASDLTEEWP